MKKLLTNRILAMVLTVCLLTGLVSVAAATQTSASEFDGLRPLMDLITNAAINAGEEPEVIGNGETSLSPSFVSEFFNLGLTADASLGITADLLTNTEQQAAYLSKVFAATPPSPLEAIAQTEASTTYIGFQPVTVNTGTDIDVQLIGEIYLSTKPMSQMSEADYADIVWLDRAVFSLHADASGMLGYIVTGFSVGSEFDIEEAIQTYGDEILVEYINTALGFSILYPSVFTDEMLVEDGDGVSATLPDDSARFFVKRTLNSANASLNEYAQTISDSVAGSKVTLNEAFNSAVVTYNTAEGFTVFSVYIITEEYIYQAELAYQTAQVATYQMYTSYMENSFAVDEVSVG